MNREEIEEKEDKSYWCIVLWLELNYPDVLFEYEKKLLMELKKND